MKPPIPPYVTGSDTSKAAAEGIAPVAYTLRERVLNFIVSRGRYGATREEVSHMLAMKHQTSSARCNELVAAGSLVELNMTRATSDGRAQSHILMSANIWKQDDPLVPPRGNAKLSAELTRLKMDAESDKARSYNEGRQDEANRAAGEISDLKTQLAKLERDMKEDSLFRAPRLLERAEKAERELGEMRKAYEEEAARAVRSEAELKKAWEVSGAAPARGLADLELHEVVGDLKRDQEELIRAREAMSTLGVEEGHLPPLIGSIVGQLYAVRQIVNPEMVLTGVTRNPTGTTYNYTNGNDARRTLAVKTPTVFEAKGRRASTRAEEERGGGRRAAGCVAAAWPADLAGSHD